MSPEVEIMSGMWDVLREYIPAKDRQVAADHLINTIADEHSLSDFDLKAFGGTDVYLKRAVTEYLGEDDEEVIDDDEEDDGL